MHQVTRGRRSAQPGGVYLCGQLSVYPLGGRYDTFPTGKVRRKTEKMVKKHLDSLYADGTKGEVFTHLMELISSKENTRMIYRTTKGNTESSTVGVDKRTMF